LSKVLRPIGHEDRLSIIDHLDELRSRLIVCGIFLVIAFAVCFWQNHALLHALNRSLPATPATSTNHISGSTGDLVNERRGLLKTAKAYTALAASSQNPAVKQAYAQAAAGMTQAAIALPQATAKRLPITIGVGEPFTTTLTVAAYFALLFALPVLIYEAYAFVIPALDPREKRLALPLMFVAPVLFLVGVAFAYFIVLPPAVRFLQGYNSENFDILVQAKTFYTFQIWTMLGIGLVFQLPLALLGLQRVGVINGRTLTKNWRYATVIMAVIAAAMPGADPVTTGLEMLPLVLLYLASIVMLRAVDRRAAARAAAEASSQLGDGLDPT
jgi:sec-independent protein translocase protein TatC